MSPREAAVITADQLAEAMASGRKLVLLDVRFDANGPGRREAYDSGHLPGAHFVDLTEALQAPSEVRGARRPLPTPTALQASFARWGIDDDSLVVAYGDGIPAGAGRAWFVLKWAGVKDVRLLDGGIAGWRAAGGEVSTTAADVGAGTFRLSSDQLGVMDADAAYEAACSGVLLDARSSQFYTGATVKGAERGGHVPGAINTPIATAFEGPYLRPEESIRALFSGLDLERMTHRGVYCGGGVAAALTALVLRTIDVPIDVYIGSWSDWEAEPLRPAATGPTPAGLAVTSTL